MRVGHDDVDDNKVGELNDCGNHQSVPTAKTSQNVSEEL